MYRAYINDNKMNIGSELRGAMLRLYPEDGIMNMISLEHGTFKCSFPVERVFHILNSFDQMIPSKQKVKLEVRKEADDVVEHYEFELRSKNMAKVAKCVSDDKWMPVLNGICVDLNACHIYASDSRILSAVAISVSVGSMCDSLEGRKRRPVFPAKMMAKLKPGLYSIDYLSDGNIRLSGNGVEFCAPKEMNECKYPDAHDTIAQHHSQYIEHGRVELPKGFAKFFDSEKKKMCKCTGIAIAQNYLAAVKAGTSQRVEREFLTGDASDAMCYYATGANMVKIMSSGVDHLDIVHNNIIRGYIWDDADIEFLFSLSLYNDDMENELWFSAIGKPEKKVAA